MDYLWTELFWHVRKEADTARMLLSEATQPLLIVSRVIGLNPKSNWHKIYSIFITVCEIFMICYVWQYYLGVDVENYYFNILVHITEDVCRVTSFLVILTPSLFDKKRYMVPLNDLAIVDVNLNSLGGNIDNRCTYRFQLFLVAQVGMVTLIFWLVKIGVFGVPEHGDSLYVSTLLYWGYCFASLIISAVMDCFFVSTVSVIRRRFKEMNLIIHRARTHGLYSRINFLEVSRPLPDNDILGHLRILRKQYHNLWRIANWVNETYGSHLLAGATTSLALIISHLWMSYTLLTSLNGISRYAAMDGLIWALFYIARMLFLVKASESTVAEAKAVSVMLQELEMFGDYSLATRSEIRDFLTQLRFEKLKFTACGFFNIEFTLICGILGAVCTYLVILIQMADSTACEGNRNSNESNYITYKYQQ